MRHAEGKHRGRHCGSRRNRVRESFPGTWREVDSLLGEFFSPQAAGKSCRSPLAQASLWEDENAFHFEVDLPGVARDDVEITFDKNQLKVSAERKTGPVDENDQRKGLVEERTYGKIERVVSLPETVDGDSIDAKLADGVLHVSIAKQPEAQPKRIEIN